jgi:hypothetical protein
MLVRMSSPWAMIVPSKCCCIGCTLFVLANCFSGSLDCSQKSVIGIA